MKKKFILLSLMLAAVFTASATVTKTIGTGGTYDYASLHAACMDLYANPLTDDCIWEICTDLNETINAGIINNTNYTLTIRPNAAEARTINYSSTNITADNDGPSGNFVIGGIPMAAQADNIPFETEPAKNVIVDGSFNGDGERHLTITSNTVGGVVVVAYGAVTNSAVKNCVITHTRTSYTTYALHVRTEKNSDNHPVDFLVDNCYLEVTGVANAQVIYFNGSQSSTSAGDPENTTIRNCEIVSNLRGIFFNEANGANIEGCTFRLPSASPGYLAHGIMGNAQTGVINVKGCKFLELKTTNVSAGEYGIQGITASGGATVWHIENNIFTGLDALASGAASKAIKLCAVRCGDSCVVRHNTFVMPVLTNKPTTELMSASPISLLYLAGTKKHFAENNIFVSHETEANNSLIRGALNENCGNNVFYHDGGNAAAIAGAVIVTGEDDLATADPTSKWKEAQFNADMSLADASIGDYDLAVAKLDDVAKDINGNDRLDPTYAGAEAPGALVGTLYEIGSNQEGGWAPNVGTLLTKVANNVFKYEAFISGEATFVFVTDLASSAEDWDYVNNRRYGATSNDLVIANGDNVDLVKGYDGNAFKVTEAGNYIVTVDFNTMKVSVVAYPKVSIAGLDGWSTDANVLEEADDHLTASKTIHLNAGWYQFKVVLNNNAWYTDHNAPADATETAPTEMNRANSTGWVFDKGDGYKNTGLRIDLEGDYEFVYTHATKALSISGFPTSFTRTVSAEDADKYQTLCVPFDATISGAAAYAFDGATETGVILNAVASDALVAGKSYLIMPEGAGDIVVSAIPEGNVVGAPEDLHGLSGFYGILGADYVYKYSENTFATYILQNDNKFHKVIGTAVATITSTHAYLHVQEGIAAPELRIIMGATNIENVEAAEQAVKFIENGQMFIKKNGVVYDMMGHAVK